MNNPIKKTEEYTENVKLGYRLPNVTTMEKLAMRITAGEGAVLKYNDRVAVCDRVCGGFIAATYEFVEDAQEADCAECECRLNLLFMSTIPFQDGGHAIARAMQIL